MSNRELYQKTFSQVHSTSTIRWEDFAQKRKPPQKPARRLWLLAAVIALLAALSIGAVAAKLLGARDLLLPPQQSAPKSDSVNPSAPPPSPQEDFISLSGFLDTPESQALAAWDAFLASYDSDGVLLDVVGNYLDESLSRYNCYGVYTQDMADKLEEIAAQYHLTLHTWNRVVDGQDAWISLLGNFLGRNTAYSGRIYEDGTFHFDGVFPASRYGELNYQFRRSVKGSLNDVFLNVGDLSAYQELHYQTAGGQKVTLDLGPDKGLILADLKDSFLLINVLAGTEQGVTRQDLEELADSFDFSMLVPAAPLEGAPQEPEQLKLVLPEPFCDVLLNNGSFYDTDKKAASSLTEFLQKAAPDGHKLTVDAFTVIDLDTDGTPEAVLRLLLDSGTAYSFEILRQGSSETIYGYALGTQDFGDLKADGSYTYSYIGSNGFGFMGFSTDTWADTQQYSWFTAPIGYMDSVQDEDGTMQTYCYLQYNEVTYEEYNSALHVQADKADAPWYPFTANYLETFFAGS